MRRSFLSILAPACWMAIVSLHASAGFAQDLDATFAKILELEDRRATGDGALSGYLETGRPLAIRVRAALAAGRIGAPVTTPFDLVTALGDAQPELRRMAAFALGEMDDIRAAPLLASVLGDTDAEVRAMAAEALGKLKDPASVPLLTARLDDPDPRVIGATLLALWKVDAGDALPRQVEKAVSIYGSSKGDLRWRAVYFLMRSQMGHPDDEQVEAALLEAAGDLDPLIRSFAARGLGASRSAQATQTLLELADDDDWRVQVNAFNGLKTRRVEAEGHARRRWRTYKRGLSDKNTGVALSALAALESCGGKEAGEHLIRALADKRPRFREVAALASAARDKSASLARIRPLGSDAVWSVRARAAEALALIGTEEVSSDLARLAADTDARVRSVAVDSIAKAKLKETAERLDSTLKDDDLFVRAVAIEAMTPAVPLPQGQADALVASLAAAYKRGIDDAHNDARLAALNVLGKTGTDAARSEVEKALDDPDYLVRRRAAEVLRDAFHLDRFSKVGEPRRMRAGDHYIEAVARASRRVIAVFDTDGGRIEVELLPADAPLTVDNFIRLARDGKLDGLAFHRVVPNFVIQDGDPRGDGNGGPPWQIRCEINLRRYTAGALGMALSGKDTGSSQYFITHSPQPHLDGGYTIFGQVISGQEIVDRMVQGDGVRHVTIEEGP